MELIPLSKIKLNPANPRVIKDEDYLALVRSVAQFPKMMQKRGIVVDKKNMALGGNQRTKVLHEILKMPAEDLKQLLGEKHADKFYFWESLREKNSIPANWIVDGSDMTEDEIRRFIIVDNLEAGDHDFAMLREQWDANELKEWGLDIPDYVDDVSGLFESVDEPKEDEGVKITLVFDTGTYESKIKPLLEEYGSLETFILK